MLEFSNDLKQQHAMLAALSMFSSSIFLCFSETGCGFQVSPEAINDGICK